MNAIIVVVLSITAFGIFVVQSRDALPGDVPWMVSLSSDYSDGEHFCSGSILDSTHILTVYECVDDMDPKSINLKARIGSLDLDKGGVQYDVGRILNVDENYNLVILCTDKEMVLDNTLPVPTGKVALPTGNTDLAPGTMVRMAGWGVNTNDGAIFTEKLQVMDIHIVSPQHCGSAYADPYIPDYITCAGAEGMDSCVGESGDPLTLNGVQYGVVYVGFSLCTLAAPAPFLDVSYFIDSINTNLQKKCFDVIPY